jgi:hypothetical protein
MLEYAMSHFFTENPSDPIAIPTEIIHAADDFPLLSGFQATAGPTFIEFKRKFQGLVIALYVVAAIEMAAGVLLVLVDLYFGIAFSVMASATLFIAVKYTVRINHIVVLDFATEMIYVGEKDIPFSAIVSLQLVKIHISSLPQQDIPLYGVELCYKSEESPIGATCLFRLVSNLKQDWDAIGEYFAHYLSIACARSVLFNAQPRDRLAKEKCARFIRTAGRYSLSWE